MPPSGTPAYFMSNILIQEDVDINKSGKILPRQPRIIVAIMVMFQLVKMIHLKSALGSEISQIEQRD